LDSTNDDDLKPSPLAEGKPPSRRNLIQGTALLMCARLVGDFGMRQSKTGLIDLCEEFRDLERLSRDMWEHDDPTFWTNLFDRQEVLAGRISAHTPRSLEDFQAIARALTGWVPGAAPYELDDLFGTDGELLSLLFRGLVDAKIN
jgi:hypothetical protein